jgi:hypothetical protein
MLFFCAALRAQQPLILPDTMHPADSTSVSDSLNDEEIYSDSTDNYDDYDDYDTTGDEDDELDTLQAISLTKANCSFGIVFGIAAVSAQDLVTYINQNAGGGSITPNSFGTDAALSSSFTWYVSPSLDAAVEYAYLTNSYQFGDQSFGGYNFSYDINRFTVMIHRLFNQDYYGVAVGAGVGYTIGFFRQVTPAVKGGEQFQTGGGNAAAEVILRSAFGDHVYLHLELQGFFAFTNALNDQGIILHTGTPPQQQNITLNSFGGSIGVGLEYFF